MDKDNIKKALDHFENDEFVDAKEILTKEIQSKRDEFVKDKVGLKDDLTPKKEDDTEV
jgi:hypothetical protein